MEHEVIQYGALIGLQAGVVLQNIYCQRVRGQLAVREERAVTKDKSREKLVGDGLPRLLTHPDFIDRVRVHARDRLDAVAARNARMTAVAEFAEKLKDWEKAEEARKGDNVGLTNIWKAKVVEWEKEHGRMKLEKKKPVEKATSRCSSQANPSPSTTCRCSSG